MKNSIIGSKPCPKCREMGRDQTGDHQMIFSDGGGYCNRCHYTSKGGSVQAPKEPVKRLLQRSSMELLEVRDLPIKPLLSRHINGNIASHYGVRVEFSQESGEECSYYFPITQNREIVAYRVRDLPKTFRNIGKKLKGEKVELFGQNVTPKGGKKLVITEGQEDMLAAHQMLLAKYPNFPPNVVSLVNGANIQGVADNLDFINKFYGELK